MGPPGPVGGSPSESSLDLSMSQGEADIGENDDAAEKRARRKSKLVNQLDTERAVLDGASPTRKRPNKPPANTNMNHAQLAEHYSDCIKLSSENKINKRNAFGLNLIDYMRDILQKNGNGFQMASASLDASAKIYSCRVDNVWDTTNQMMVNLVSSNKKQGKGGEEAGLSDAGIADMDDMPSGLGGAEDGDDTNADGPSKLKKKKKIRRGKTIETNLNNIRVSHFDSNFEKDPLFQILSESFDSGTGGLLLNHLHSVDDSNSLHLDSNALRDRESEKSRALECAAASCVVREDLFDVSQLTNRFVCPSLRTFKFGGTGAEENGDDSVLSQIINSQRKDGPSQEDEEVGRHAFDMDAEVEPVDDVAQMDDLVEGPLDYDEDGGGGGGGGEMDEDIEPMDIRVGNNDSELNIGASIANRTGADLSNLSILSQSLVNSIEQLNEFSYFKSDKLKLWMGPDRWKPTSFGATRPNAQTMAALQKKRKEKEKFVFTYDEDVSKTDQGKPIPPDNLGMWDEALKKSRAATETSQITLKKWREEDKKNQLESFLTEEDLKGFSLNLRKDLFMQRSRTKGDATAANVDGGVGDYNYANAQDKDFVPAINDDNNYDDDYGGGDDDIAGDDFAAAVDAYADLEEPLGNIKEFGGPSQAGFAAAFTQDNLIAAPNQVAALDIAYAKQAKKIDIKRLKGTFWRILTSTSDTTANETMEGEAPKTVSSEAVGRHSFHGTISAAKSLLPPSMAENLSVPLAFVSMLYVVNEKSLRIEGQSDLQDFYLSQDTPPTK